MEAQEDVDGRGASLGAGDHYSLLRVDPDAPQELIAEAYWYLAGRLRAQMPLRNAASRHLDILNTAYSVLVDPDQRRAYDERIARVVQLRRERAQRRQAREQRPLLARLLGKRQRAEIDSSELLRIDPLAEPFLIDRAYSIMRELYSSGSIAGAADDQLALLAKARSDLLERFARYPQPTTAEAMAESVVEPPEFLLQERFGSTSDQQTPERHE